MITKIGALFTEGFKKAMPNSFVFALILTLCATLAALFWVDATFIETVEGWYNGFWILLEFGMQITLILVTGYSIALSSVVKKGINKIAKYINSPKKVYLFVILIGLMFSMISWGWLVITAVLARELAMRIKGLNYYFLIACVYFSGGAWVCGLSSSIPLLLNTQNNFLIEQEILSDIIPTTYTLGSTLNIAVFFLYLIVTPILFYLLIPKKTADLPDLLITKGDEEVSIEEEANAMKLPVKAISDTLNNSWIAQFLVATMGLVYIVYYFFTKGLDLNLNIMIFIFIILGLYLHKNPSRYGIAMKRASANISGILFQYPFYAAIMGIMISTGLGSRLADTISNVATIDTYPFYAFLTGALVNFAIPSAGGEFAVIGPSMLEAIKEIGINSSPDQMQQMIAKGSLSIAYGETLTNLLQPFFLLIVLPIMGKGIKVQARDVMGYLLIPFLVFFVLFSLIVLYVPI